jgi:predicted NBD/HSP70 family sugar kinase
MAWFTKAQTEAVETTPELTPQERYEESLHELSVIDAEMKAADAALRNMFQTRKDPRVIFVGGRIYAAVNAMKNTSPEIRAVESRWAATFRKFQQKMVESAELKRAAGLVR